MLLVTISIFDGRIPKNLIKMCQHTTLLMRNETIHFSVPNSKWPLLHFSRLAVCGIYRGQSAHPVIMIATSITVCGIHRGQSAHRVIMIATSITVLLSYSHRQTSRLDPCNCFLERAPGSAMIGKYHDHGWVRSTSIGKVPISLFLFFLPFFSYSGSEKWERNGTCSRTSNECN